MEIRHFQPGDDALAVSRVYEESWRFAYRDIIPQAYLDGIPVGKWCAAQLEENGMRTLVMLEGDEYIGVSRYGPSRFPDFPGWGEVVSLYLRLPWIGKGYGRALLEAASRELAAMGFDRVFLWVLEENRRARAFYERAGFSPSGRWLDNEIGGKPLRELAYCRPIAARK